MMERCSNPSVIPPPILLVGDHDRDGCAAVDADEAGLGDERVGREEQPGAGDPPAVGAADRGRRHGRRSRAGRRARARRAPTGPRGAGRATKRVPSGTATITTSPAPSRTLDAGEPWSAKPTANVSWASRKAPRPGTNQSWSRHPSGSIRHTSPTQQSASATTKQSRVLPRASARSRRLRRMPRSPRVCTSTQRVARRADRYPVGDREPAGDGEQHGGGGGHGGVLVR